jgi:mycothiol system anti-sigma-R factor
VRALNAFIDRELSDEDIIQVRQHLDDCRGCLYAYEFEESVRRLIKKRCQELSAPDGLRARLVVRLELERQRLERRHPRGTV